MSFGKTKSSGTSSSQQTSNQTLDPTIMGDLQSNYLKTLNMANTPYQPYSGEQVAGFTPAQQQAQAGVLGVAANNVGGSTLDNAVSTTGGVAGYKPPTVTGSTYTPSTMAASTAGPAALATPASIDRSSIANLNTSGISGSDIQKFMDPYLSSVVGATTSALQNQFGQEANANNANATLARAWRGDRAGVTQALTNEADSRTLASTVSSLMSAGYSQATATALANAQQQQAAAQANQGVDLSVAGTNAGYAQQSDLANQQAQNQQAQFNATQQQNAGATNIGALNTAGAFNAGQTQAADLANQGASVAGAGLNLSAGTDLASMSAQQLAQALGLQSAVGQVGQQQQTQQQAVDTSGYNQYLAAQNWPIMLQQLLNQALGLAGNPTLTSSQGTSAGTNSSSGFQFGLQGGGSSSGSTQQAQTAAGG